MPAYWIIAPYHADKPELWDQVWNYDLAHNLISIGWGELGDASSLDEDQLKKRIEMTYPDTAPNAKTLHRRMYRDFYHSINVGDVIIARRGRKVIAGIGTVTRRGYYEQDKNMEALGPQKAYSNHLDVRWDPAPRNRRFDVMVFGMQTLYEIPPEKFRTLTAGEASERKQDLPLGETDSHVQLATPLEPPDPQGILHSLTIGVLDAANEPPVSVRRDLEIRRAITTMRLNEYSQLPVMPTLFKADGWISWKSIGLSGRNPTLVRDCIDEDVVTLWDDHPLLDAVSIISKKEVVLIKSRGSREIVGLVTTSDLVDYYHSLAEPFLLIREIENYVRLMISRGRFNRQVLQSAKHSNDTTRNIESVADLSLGESVRFLENPTHWEAIQINELRDPILERLRKVNEIRNKVMHFHPILNSYESLEKTRYLHTLRTTVKFFSSLL